MLMTPDIAPPLSCDCHFHVFGPYARFPLDAGRRFSPGEALVEDYLTAIEGLGLQRLVVVQPSPYGTDNRATLEALRQFGPDRARAVVVVDDSIDAAALAAMNDAGVRGVRFNLVSGNGLPEELLPVLAERIAPLGWHIQIYAKGEKLEELAPLLTRLPTQVVLDHCGGVRPALGIDHPQFATLMRLLEAGNVWVKTASYRISSAGAPWTDMADNVRALIRAAPDRCVWGSDWPHSLIEGPPNPALLLQQFLDWVPETALRQRILVDNPARLYGF
jgi:predicted TIM-barrel fold metal-dependent hydrolase